MSKKVQPTTMDKVRDAILGADGRGSLYRWLRRHHDEMQEMLDQVPRPDWQAITAALREENLLDAAGKPPTAERVRQTWVKVRKDVETANRKRATKAQPVPAYTATKIFEPIRETPPPTPISDDAAARIEKLRRDMAKRSGRDI